MSESTDPNGWLPWYSGQLCMSLLGGRHIFEVVTACPVVATFRNRQNGFVFHDRLQNYVPWRPAFQLFPERPHARHR